jgi:hypothetical protein
VSNKDLGFELMKKPKLAPVPDRSRMRRNVGASLTLTRAARMRCDWTNARVRFAVKCEIFQKTRQNA